MGITDGFHCYRIQGTGSGGQEILGLVGENSNDIEVRQGVRKPNG
jgi:hypothetical protein